MSSNGQPIHATSVELLRGSVLRLVFHDGTARERDVEEFLSRAPEPESKSRPSILSTPSGEEGEVGRGGSSYSYRRPCGLRHNGSDSARTSPITA